MTIELLDSQNLYTTANSCLNLLHYFLQRLLDFVVVAAGSMANNYFPAALYRKCQFDAALLDGTFTAMLSYFAGDLLVREPFGGSLPGQPPLLGRVVKFG